MFVSWSKLWIAPLLRDNLWWWCHRQELVQ